MDEDEEDKCVGFEHMDDDESFRHVLLGLATTIDRSPSAFFNIDAA